MTSGYEEGILRQIDRLKKIAPSDASTRRAIFKTSGALLQQQAEGAIVEPKRNARHPHWRFALGGCAVASIAATACLVLLWRESMGFAEVQREIARIRTVTYDFVSGEADARVTTRHIVSGTRWRSEWPGHTRICVPDEKTVLLINHDERTAGVSRDNSDQQTRATDWLGLLASIAESSVKRIGQRTVDGKRTIGFEVPETGNGEPMMVWVDPATRLPIRIEAVGNRVLKNFQFNVDVSEDLFRLAVPEGYFVENRYRVPQAPIKLDEDELRKYAALVADSTRSPQQTIEAYLKLAAAGKTALVRKLQRNPSPDDIREMDGFEELKLADMFATKTVALGVTSAAIANRGERCSMVFTVKQFDGEWLIDDIDLETRDGVREEIQRFLAEYADAEEID